jgi:hypothetical protein
MGTTALQHYKKHAANERHCLAGAREEQAQVLEEEKTMLSFVLSDPVMNRTASLSRSITAGT